MPNPVGLQGSRRRAARPSRDSRHRRACGRTRSKSSSFTFEKITTIINETGESAENAGSLSDLTPHSLISLSFSSFLINKKRNNISMLRVSKTSSPTGRQECAKLIGGVRQGFRTTAGQCVAASCSITFAATQPGHLLPLLVSGTTFRVQYEWDNGKAADNIRKHSVDFMDAIAALEDPNRLEEIDARLPYDEERISGHRNGSRQGAFRGRDVPRRGHLQNHIGPKGHET